MCRWSCILTSRSPIVEPLGQVEGDKVLERVEHGSCRDEELPVCEVALGLGKICTVCQLTPRPERNSRTREEIVEHRWERQEGKGRGLHQVYSTRLMGLQTYVMISGTTSQTLAANSQALPSPLLCAFMASTLAPSPSPAMLPAGDSVTVQRPPSIRSVASSTCSSASGVSLSRKPRIRPRSRTVTGASTAPIARPLEVEVPDLPYLGIDLVQEPSPIRNSESEGESRLAEKQPAMPQLQPRRPSDGPEQDAQSSGTSSTHNSDLGAVETTFVGSQLSPESKDGKTVCIASVGLTICVLTLTWTSLGSILTSLQKPRSPSRYSQLLAYPRLSPTLTPRPVLRPFQHAHTMPGTTHHPLPSRATPRFPTFATLFRRTSLAQHLRLSTPYLRPTLRPDNHLALRQSRLSHQVHGL